MDTNLQQQQQQQQHISRKCTINKVQIIYLN